MQVFFPHQISEVDEILLIKLCTKVLFPRRFYFYVHREKKERKPHSQPLSKGEKEVISIIAGSEVLKYFVEG